MHILPFQALYPNLQFSDKMSDLFDTAKERFTDLLQADLFLATPHPAFFIYEILLNERRHRGVLACVEAADYQNGIILKHEATLPAEERKQMLLTLERGAAVKPILIVYQNVGLINQWISRYIRQQPVFLEITFEDEIHRLWQVQQTSEIQELQQLFATKVAQAYIADGHHRMAAMGLIAESADVTLRERYKQVYCAFFAASELNILAFNRVVEVPADFTVQQLERFCTIQPLPAPAVPTAPHELTLCTPQGWFQLRWKPSVLENFATEQVVIDTQVLNEKVWRALFGITDIRHDRRVQYLDAAKGLTALAQKVAEQPNRIGFCLYPVAFQDLQTIVTSGKTLPPKSTWFEPRMKNGLLVKSYRVEGRG